jgi:hypothetical protein
MCTVSENCIFGKNGSQSLFKYLIEQVLLKIMGSLWLRPVS